MKKMLIAAALFLGTQHAYAAPCIAGSLADYIVLGAGGCQIGANTLSDFTTFPVSAGATEIAATSIGVTPVASGPSGFGLDFLVSKTANAGTVLEFLVGYQVSGSGLTTASLSIEGTQVAPDGAVTAVKELCLDDVFLGPGTCPGTVGPTLIVADDGANPLLSLQDIFGPVSSLFGVLDDIAISGGTNGSATLATASNRFSAADGVAVPAPGTAALIGFGLLCIGATLRHRKAVTA